MKASSHGAMALAERWAAKAQRRAIRQARRVYYRHLYGLDFPGKTNVVDRLTAWELSDGRGDVPIQKEAWEAQYSGGRWDFLAGLKEVPHNAVIAAFAARLKPGGAVLDVGCGSGALHEHLLRAGYSRYLGVDISETAVSGLSEAGHPNATFVATDAESFGPEDPFDVIVFNESMTYFRSPATTFARYFDALRPGGFGIVSCHLQSDRAQAILRSLVDSYPSLTECIVQGPDSGWRIVVFSARAD